MTKPNILWINTDDMRDDFLDYMPHVMNLLVRKGRRYNNARTHVAVCPTSRYTTFTQLILNHQGPTGALPVKVGTFQLIPDSNAGPTEHAEHSNNIGAWLQAVGYQTLMLGKYMNFSVARNPVPAGWTRWREFVGDDSYNRLGFSVSDNAAAVTSPAGPMGQYSANEVNDFIDDAVAANAPWFAYWAPPDPHLPFNSDVVDQFKFDHIDWPITYQADVSTAPSWVSNYPYNGSFDNTRAFQETARSQLRELAELDRWIKVVIDHIETIGAISNTYIFFTSDNGMKYGEHRSSIQGLAKNDFFSVGSRVPMVVRGPGVVRGVSSVSIDMQHDVGRTIIEVSEAEPGRSLPQVMGARGALSTVGYNLVGLDPPADRHALLARGGALNGSFISTNPYTGECAVGPQYWVARYRETPTASDWVSPVYPDIPIATDTVEMYDYINDPHEHANLGNSTVPAVVTARNAALARLDALIPI